MSDNGVSHFANCRFIWRGLMLAVIVAVVMSACGAESVFASAVPAETEVVRDSSSDTFGQACQLVYQGEFADAAELIDKHSCDRKEDFAEIAAITHEYEALEKRRADAKRESYEKKWEKLQVLRWSDSNDVNEVNEPSTVFSMAAALADLANGQQKKQILDAAIVRQAIGRATTKSLEYEAQGKWFDAYTNCWYWLEVLDKDNQQYKEHTDELIEKANILSTFQDSPCETSKQRFQKVEPSMFKRAIEVIDTTYVNPMFIDYSKMAKEALKRCKLLAEVVRNSYSQILESRRDEGDVEVMYCPDPNSVKAWSEALDAMQSEVEQDKESISRERFIDLFDNVLVLNSVTATLPKSVLIAHFAEASLSVLDPHTVIVWPGDVEDFKKSLTGEFSGVGILISREKGLLTAASLLPDTPAYKSGLDAGDIIEAVDGVPTKDMSLDCAVKHITGPAGTVVKLTVRTPGDDTSHELSIVRAKIVVQTIRGWQRATDGQWQYMVDQQRKIGYVRLTSFSDNTADEFETVLRQLEKDGLQALILDLRYNLGGLLDSAVDVADKFIRKGLIVRTQPRWGIPDYRSATGRGTHPDYPLVVLVNRYSASASEIVAGALQDAKYHRAIIIGERTHGKGSVQQVSYRPGGGAQLKFTIAYYHLPSGQRVESREDMEKLGRSDWGIAPDVVVELTGEEMTRLTDVQRDNDVLAKADHNVDAVPLSRHSLQETLEADPQLTVALLVIRTKLLEQGRAVAALN